MQLTLDTDDHGYQIKSYEPGTIVVNNQQIHHSIIITAEKLISPWKPKTISDITANDLERLIQLNKDIVILGIGQTNDFLNPDLVNLFHKNNIGIEVMDTAAACRTYNVLLSEKRRVAAGLLV